MIVDEWVNGSMPIFGYFYAHYLFSCALIMAISSQIHSDQCNDFALFETSLEILRAMGEHGNLAATEFYDNLVCVRRCLDGKRSSTRRDTLLTDVRRMSDQATINPMSIVPGHATGHILPETTAPGNVADEMAFLGESMEEFLAQPDVDIGPLSSGIPIGVADAVYWPNDSLWTA